LSCDSLLLSEIENLCLVLSFLWPWFSVRCSHQADAVGPGFPGDFLRQPRRFILMQAGGGRSARPQIRFLPPLGACPDWIFCLRVPRLGPFPREAAIGELLFVLTNPNPRSLARVPGGRPMLCFSEPGTCSGTAGLNFSAKFRHLVISF
jgi:hypothetical protein